MATYYDIFGQKVQYLSSDPANVTEGQVWYNSTSNTAKVRSLATAVWSSGASTPYAARGTKGFADSKNAAIMVGGYITAASSNSISYNGTAWTGTPSLNTATYASSCGVGSFTSAIIVGGAGGNNEEWNGSSWSNITAYPNNPNSVENTGGFGSTSDGYFLGGSSSPASAPTVKPSTINWNGSAWTSLNPMNIGRTDMGSCGTGTAGLVFGGESGVPPAFPGSRDQTESWDGTSWTSSPASLNNLRYAFSSGQNGPAATNWAAAGYVSNTAPYFSTEEYNGTVWSNSPATVTYEARGGQGYGGVAGASGIMANGTFPGNPSFNTNGCSEFDPGGAVTETITTS